MDRRIVVLGTDHALQGAEKIRPEKKTNDPTYRVLVDKLIKDYSVDCIFEEASGCGPTAASGFERPGLRYFDVDLAGTERYQLGIPPGLPFEGYVIYEINDPRMPKPEPLATQKSVATELSREQHWVEKISKEQFTNGLMICGAAHTFSVASRLLSSGISVDVIMYLGPTPKSLA
jgi:hypothetical protein